MHTLPELPYGYDALGTRISKRVMELHHDKHHRGYVDKLNQALEGHEELAALPIGELMRSLGSVPAEIREKVRNMGGGHYNHSLFWQWMSPDGGDEPGGALGEGISERYGSFQAFMDAYQERSLGVFGSGWSWLMPDLSIVTTQNQDTPVSDGNPEPLLGLDVWEHAYYLDYQNQRADYVKAWWHVVNWSRAEEAYEAARKA